jgi:hypothetical protein
MVIAPIDGGGEASAGMPLAIASAANERTAGLLIMAFPLLQSALAAR